jgi:hypothetical protein
MLKAKDDFGLVIRAEHFAANRHKDQRWQDVKASRISITRSDWQRCFSRTAACGTRLRLWLQCGGCGGSMTSIGINSR